MNRRSKLGQIALAVLLVLGLMLTVVACGNSEQSNNEEMKRRSLLFIRW